MKQEVLNLADKQIQLTISNALNCLTQISSSNRSVKLNVLLRFRSSSTNTIPRCSIPATKNDLAYYQLRLYYPINKQIKHVTRHHKILIVMNRIEHLMYNIHLVLINLG
jgi:hypothetical protein